MKSIKSTLALVISVNVLAFVPPISAMANEGCNGPVFHPASTTGGCPCSIVSPPSGGWTVSCGSTITIINDYTSCGGNTTLTCDTMSQTIGHTYTCVVASYNGALYQIAVAAWLLCEGSGPQTCGPKPMPCDYTVCGYRTPGTAIPGSVYTGSDGECTIAKIDFKAAPLQQKLAILASFYKNS
jgi:hypothetical protein